MVEVLKDLEAGRIGDTVGAGARAIDMSRVMQPYGCGSVGCVAGYMAVRLSKRNHFKYYEELVRRSVALSRLINAQDYHFMNDARARHVSRAIRNFLRTGNANWPRAMGKDAA